MWCTLIQAREKAATTGVCWLTPMGSPSTAHGGWARQEVAMTGAHMFALLGVLPSVHRGRGWRVGREDGIVAQPLAHHLTMVPCFHGSPCFLQENTQLHSSSFLSAHMLSAQPTTVLSPGLLSNPTLQHPTLASIGRYLSQAGAQRTVACRDVN